MQAERPPENGSMMPYRLPMPREALREIVVQQAVLEDERLWVPQANNVWFRPLCLNRSPFSRPAQF